MAYNPFNVFRRNQKALFAILTVFILTVFVTTSPNSPFVDVRVKESDFPWDTWRQQLAVVPRAKWAFLITAAPLYFILRLWARRKGSSGSAYRHVAERVQFNPATPPFILVMLPYLNPRLPISIGVFAGSIALVSALLGNSEGITAAGVVVAALALLLATCLQLSFRALKNSEPRA